MKKKILYLHGFESSGKAIKAQQLREHFTDYEILSPTLDVEPNKVIEQLHKIMMDRTDKESRIYLTIGSSLGGFYGLYIFKKFDAPVLLINPSLEPFNSLKDRINIPIKRYGTDEEFIYKSEYLDQLKAIDDDMKDTECMNYYLNFFLACDDELINHNQVKKIYPYSNIHWFDNSGHRFSNFKETFPIIKKLLIHYSK